MAVLAYRLHPQGNLTLGRPIPKPPGNSQLGKCPRDVLCKFLLGLAFNWLHGLLRRKPQQMSSAEVPKQAAVLGFVSTLGLLMQQDVHRMFALVRIAPHLH